MRHLLRPIRSQIKYRIILPYLLLMILVTLAGSGIALILVANSWQERFHNQLGQTARNFTRAMAQREIDNINFLGRIAFTTENVQTGAPAVAEAMRQRDIPGLKKALETLYRSSVLLDDLVLDRLIAFDTGGKALVDWERSSINPVEPRENIGTDLSGLDPVRRVAQGDTEQVGEVTLDKFSALVKFKSLEGEGHYYFVTVVPVRAGPEQQTVGGLLIASRLDNLLQDLQIKSQSAITSIYDANGRTLSSTVPGVDLAKLDMSGQLLLDAANLDEQARALWENQSNGPPRTATQSGDEPQSDVCLDIGTLPGGLSNPIELNRPPTCSVRERKHVTEREYEFVYAPLLIRGVQFGYFSTSLSRDFVISAYSSSRWAVVAITALLAVGAVLVGYQVARQITRPLSDLVETAEAVTQGQLDRRSQVVADNELGKLAMAFNQMTEHLLRLYTVSRELNQAIEIRRVLDVATTAASSFVPGTEVLVLLDEREGWHYTIRNDASETITALQGLQIQDPQLLIDLFTDDPTARTCSVPDEPALQAAGLGDQAGFTTVFLTPLIMDEQIVGLLALGHPASHAFSEADEQALAAVANMTVTVLQNAVLYMRVQKDATERQAILTSIGDGVVVCDEQGCIMLMNPVAEQMLNLLDWRERRYSFAALPLEPVRSTPELFGRSNNQEHYRIGARTVSRTDSKVVAEDGRVIGKVIVLHDISAAVAVDQAKTDFIASISHELRSPLTVIMGYIDLLLRGTCGPLNADQAEFLELVRARANDMTAMVSNAIMIAHIESGDLRTDIQPQDLWAIVESALAPLRPAFAQKGLEITLPDLTNEVPLVMADREHLKQALTQLLKNAHRYTNQGGISIRAYPDGALIRLDIEDTGQGIPADIQRRLFTRFQRVEGNNSQVRGGGLGLAITKQLIERQGGSVFMTSEPGKGSTFSIVLPQANEHTLAVAQSSAETAASS